MNPNPISKSWGLPILLGAMATACWAAPVSDATPRAVVDVKSGYLLGGSINGRWVKDTSLARGMKGGERYRVYGKRGLLGSGTGTRPKSEGAPCEETLFSRVTPNFGTGEIAIGGSWNVMPRTPQVLGTTQPTYVRAVADLLKKHGIKRPQVKIAQLWRVDLDGDGTDEVLLSATRHIGQAIGPKGVAPTVQAGDYSLLLLRHMVRGQLKTAVLSEEYHTKSSEFSAPNEFTIGGVLDANGDGKMEIIARSRYYEGDSVAVIEMRDERPVEVLNEGCGA